MKIEKELFGKTKNNQEIYLFKITNKNNISISTMNYGATLLEFITPNSENSFNNILLRLDTFKEYSDGHPYLGSICGRYSNRICKGLFSLNEKEYKLVRNIFKQRK
jgi:aldose 1-epimerase